MTDKGPVAIQKRSWRPLRRMVIATLVVLGIQFLFGVYVTVVAVYPTAPGPISSIGDLFSAMSSAAGPSLFAHAFIGILVLVMILGDTAIASRYHNTRVTTACVLSLISMAAGVLGGYVWASSDFATVSGIPLMIVGAVASLVLLIVALLFIGRAGKLQRAANP